MFNTFSGSLGSTLESEGLESQQSVQIAESIREGVTSEHVAANYAVPVRQVEQIADAQRDAVVDGLRAPGVIGWAAFIGACLVIFLWSRREHADPRPPRRVRRSSSDLLRAEREDDVGDVLH